MTSFVIALACFFATCAAIVPSQSRIDSEQASSDCQCLIQSPHFRLGFGFISEDVTSTVEEDRDDNALVEIEKSIGCAGTGTTVKANVDGVEPRCKTVDDCPSKPKKTIACISNFCTDPAKVKFDWSPAIVDSYCPCHDLGKKTLGQADLAHCKKKCEEMPTCTGFTWGKSGDVHSGCWFFSTCTKTTAKEQLKKDTTGTFNVFFLSANSEIEVPVLSFKRMDVVFRGRRRPPADRCLSAGNCNDIPGIVLDPPIQCTDGVCHDPQTEKFTWTLAVVSQMCQIPGAHFLGQLVGKGHKILECKKKCEAMTGCTGFNRGKKGRIRAHCWFFAKCGKHTPRYFKRNTMYNMYFVTGTSTIPVPVETFETKPVTLRG